MTRSIIFADWEFTGLYPDGTEFLSLALIKETGEEFYIEIETSTPINDFTKEHVVPHLRWNPVTKEEARKQILAFVGNDKPYFLSYVPSFDWMWICGLFWVFEVPFFWIPLDFATLLYSKGIEPDTLPETLAIEHGISLENHKKHSALNDARLIKKLYEHIILGR